jgi:polysaccharide deacetylase family protein (PEP-CTERM system associated)
MNILTFDLEDWFHVLDYASTRTEIQWESFPSRIRENTDRILSLLDTKNQRATFFCLGWVARKYPDVIRKISATGHEIGCHSDLHQLVYETDEKRFREDLQTAIKSIEDTISTKVVSYRAPGFSVKESCSWFFEALIECGIEVDSSVFPSKRAHGGFESFGANSPVLVTTPLGTLKELPINTVSILGRDYVFSGGGYFRITPLWLLRRWIRKSDYVMTYFHPRDFDPDQPMLEGLPLIRKFKSYYGLKSAFGKLDSVLNEFQFVDLRSAVKAIKWDNVRNVSIAVIRDQALRC